MSEKRFQKTRIVDKWGGIYDSENDKVLDVSDVEHKLNKQQATISKLEEEKGYWKSKAMTLLMQVRRLTPRMTAKEVIEFSKELEDE